MTAAPLVSVVIPSYNHRDYIGAAIQSVYEQTYQPIELVIVDDGSSDDSPALIETVLEQSPLAAATLLRQENQGAHAALQRGIEASEGEVVALLNSDDFYLPLRLQKLTAALQDQPLGLAFSALTCVDSAGRPRASNDPWTAWYEAGVAACKSCPSLGFALLLNNFSVTSSNFVFRRALYDRLGGFSQHKFCHDWDFLMRAVLLEEPVFLPESLLAYRVHDSNSTLGLRDSQVEEVSSALNGFLQSAMAEPAANTMAPTPQNWPNLFPEFVSERPFHFGDEAIAFYIDPLLRLKLFEAAVGQRTH